MQADAQTAKRRRLRQKSIALQLALQLPDDQADALAVLADAKWLVENYLVYDEDSRGDEKSNHLKVVGS